MPVRMTRDLAFRAGVDHGNRSMSAAGRSAWDDQDYNAAILMFNALWPLCPHMIDPDDWCPYCDEPHTRREQAASQLIF